ncbi:hypothetical protein BDV12DRAFT_207475 [Aspergillus spectabilis]
MAQPPPSPAQSQLDVRKDMVRGCSYHRLDFDLAVASVNPTSHEPVRASLIQHTPASASLGDLQVLPLEILREICLHLDIASLFSIRHVNKQARSMVHALHPYRRIINHALDTLCVVFRTTTASHFTLSDLTRALNTKKCHTCGSFAHFIFLPTLSRTCLGCLQEAPQFHVLSQADLKKKCTMKAIINHVSKSVPPLKTLPGKYRLDQISQTKSMLLFSERLVNSALRVPHSTKPSSHWEANILRLMAATTMPYVDPVTGDVEIGVSCAGCQIAVDEVDDEGAFLSFEFMNGGDLYRQRDMVYSEEEFLAHFKECRQAQKLWDSSLGGKCPVDLPYSVTHGGSFEDVEASASHLQDAGSGSPTSQ